MHKSFRPRVNDKDFFTKGLPQPQPPSAKGGESLARGAAHGHRRDVGPRGQGGWVPPTSFFNPYFEVIRAHVHNMIAPMEGSLDKRFELERGYL